MVACGSSLCCFVVVVVVTLFLFVLCLVCPMPSGFFPPVFSNVYLDTAAFIYNVLIIKGNEKIIIF